MKKYFKFIEIESSSSKAFKTIRQDLYQLSIEILIHINNSNFSTFKNYLVLPDTKLVCSSNAKQTPIKYLINFSNSNIDNNINNDNIPSREINSLKFKEFSNSEKLLNNFLFFQSLLNIIYFEEDFGIKYEIGELIKNIIDDSYTGDKEAKHFNLFYDH